MQIFFGLVAALSTVASSRTLIHLFQLESYQLPGYRRAVERNPLRSCWYGAACALVSSLLTGLASSQVSRLYIALDTQMTFAKEAAWMLGAAFLSLVFAGAMELLQRKIPAKKPLVITPRVKRFYGVLFALSLAVSLVLLYGLRIVAIALLLPALSPFVVALAALCASPMEKSINHGYFKDAQKRLADRPDLIKIGITGSYGKTSTKFMLATLLSEKYKTLFTPSSFNTPMGITRVVREQLLPEHEVFIAEMGARHVGEIKELCDLVHPKYGIISSVGPQHLETFFTQENITNTKYELAEAIPEDGAIVFPADGGICQALYEKTIGKPKHLAGGQSQGQGMTVRNVQVGPWGSRFTLCGADGQSVDCETRLLGEHNIQNLLLACTLATVLGLDLEQISAGIQKVEPVEHRLQLLPTNNGVTVIDDAFNSNPAGARAALKVLQSFPKRRVLVTPGMVELGAEEDQFNRAFGKEMLGAADLVILVGHQHTEPIAEGLREAGFDMACVHRVANLEESTALLGKLLRAGDTVLFENDLPDNY